MYAELNLLEFIALLKPLSLISLASLHISNIILSPSYLAIASNSGIQVNNPLFISVANPLPVTKKQFG